VFTGIKFERAEGSDIGERSERGERGEKSGRCTSNRNERGERSERGDGGRGEGGARGRIESDKIGCKLRHVGATRMMLVGQTVSDFLSRYLSVEISVVTLKF
jgi:hypothetical protein